MTGNTNVRLGVIGAGNIAKKIHLPILATIEHGKVAAVCDVVEDRAEQAAEAFGIPSPYTHYKQMLANEALDAVVVLTEPDQLFRPALVSLETGHHVFMEKPAGVTSLQAGTLKRAAQQAGRILHVGLNRRYIPLLRHVVQLVREHTRITQVTGCFMKNASGMFWQGSSSAFMVDTIHVIDAMRWIAGAEPEEAATVCMRIDEEEVINAWNAVIRFTNGVTGIIQANYRVGTRTHGFEIHGPGASAFIDLGRGETACRAEIFLASGKGTQSQASSGHVRQQHLILDGKEIAGSDDFNVFYGYRAELEEFVDCVRNGGQPQTHIEEAMRSMQMVEFLEAQQL